MPRGFEIVSYFKNKGVILPTRATEGSAGYDIRVFTDGITVEIPPNGRHLFHTGVKAFMEPDVVLMLYVRSSVGIKKGLVLSNSVGVIDASYYNNEKTEGELLISLLNTSNVSQYIEHNQRVVQGIFTRFLTVYDDQLYPKAKRQGGIGSTDLSACA